MRQRFMPFFLLLLVMPHQTHASALGQLEGLAGRSVNSVKVPMPSRPSPVTPSGAMGALSGAAAASKAASALGALNMGMQLFDIIDALSAPTAVDTTQQQLLEQQRQEQERLRSLRLQSAEQLRSSWDQADAAHSASLDGVLDVPVRSGTSFFGIPGNPSGGVLPGQPVPVTSAPAASSPATVKTVRQSPHYSATEPETPQLTTDLPRAHTEILTKGYEEYSRRVAKDILTDAFEKGIALLPAKWNAELIYEHKKNMGTFIDEIFTTLDPKRLVETIVHGTPAEMARLEQQISSESTESARRLGFGETILDEDEPKFLIKLFGGEKVSTGEAWGLVKGRVYSAGIDTTTDRLLFGGE